MKNIARNLVLGILLLLIGTLIALAWGFTGHKIINRKAVVHLPAFMNSFKAESLFFEEHSTDPDRRRNYSDTSFYAEWPRHYIDIDDYPNFHSLSHDIDSVIARFGWEYVKQDGVNPWATKWVFDSLTAQLARGDTMAKYTASDLGHYVADAHQPLHCTYNYDGQATGNFGIHSRYETQMISTYQSFLAVEPESVRYISSPVDFAFSYIYHSNSLVDSVLQADTYAKAVSGWTGTGTPPPAYYAALWEKTGPVTRDQFQRATVTLASLWYTAWLNAGLSTSVEDRPTGFPVNFSLHQNYPNPFNPLTTISYQLARKSFVTLKVFSMDGKTAGTLVRGEEEEGEHAAVFDASNVASGVYLYRLQVGAFSQTRKMIVLR